MFLVAYLGEVPLLGIPACGLYHRITVLDLALARILAGERIGRTELAFLVLYVSPVHELRRWFPNGVPFSGRIEFGIYRMSRSPPRLGYSLDLCRRRLHNWYIYISFD